MKGKKGLTLIELVIVIGVISISVPVIFGLFLLSLKTQSKIYILQEAKRNGDYALNVIENMVKQYVVAVHSDIPAADNEVCTAADPGYSSGDLYFEDRYGNWFRFYLSADDTIASQSSIPDSSVELTNRRVRIIKNAGIPFLSCRRTSAFSPPLISISFTITQLGTDLSTPPEERVSMTYQTKIKLRTY